MYPLERRKSFPPPPRSLREPLRQPRRILKQRPHSRPRCSACDGRAPLPPNADACTGCGRRLGDPVSAIAQSPLDRHLHRLGILGIVLAGLFMVPPVLLLFLGHLIHAAITTNTQLDPARGSILCLLAEDTLAMLAAGGISVGLGRMQHRTWARAAALILGMLAIFHPPPGTALGISTRWVLLADGHGTEYRYMARSA
jgi:hypothetical protein